MTTIYLAGPMTGIANLNFPMFNAEAARLRALGYVVVNPAEINGGADEPADRAHAEIERQLWNEAVDQRKAEKRERQQQRASLAAFTNVSLGEPWTGGAQ